MTEMPEKSDAFRQNVREDLRLRGITQGELARRAKISQVYLSLILSGKSNPSLAVCEKIAAGLETSLEALIAPRTTSSAKAEPAAPHFVAELGLTDVKRSVK
jgi:transcriptional regulator with XRE-family HTH domain